MSEQFINDMPDEVVRERIRSEILANVDKRAEEAQRAFSGLMTYLGIVYTGSTAAVLGHIGIRIENGVPYFSIASFACLVASLVSFAIFYQRHSQLMAARSYSYAVTAQNFFLRRASVQELLEVSGMGQSRWLYRLIFWVPLLLAVAGYVLGALGLFSVGPSLPGIAE